MQLIADGLAQLFAPLGGAVHIFVQVVKALFPLQLQDGGSGDQLIFRIGPGEIQIFTGVENGGAGGTDVHILGPVLIQEINGLPQLGAPDNGIVHKQQLLVPDQLVHGNLLHLGYHIPLTLVGGHKAPGPGRGILDKGPGKGYAAFVGVADGVGGAGIGHAAYIVNVLSDAVFPVGLGHNPAVAVAHDFHVFALIAGGGIAVVGPEEGADFLFLPGLCQNHIPVGRELHHLAGAQLPVEFIAQLLTGVIFKGNAVALRILFQDDGKPAQLVPGGNQVAVILQNQNGRCAFNQVLGKTNALREGAFLVNQSGNQFVGIDSAAAHGLKVTAAEGQVLAKQCFRIINDANGADGIGAQLGADQQRLGIGIGNAANGCTALHFAENSIEFGTEGGILDIMNLPLQAQLLVISSHTAPAGTQVRMIVGAEEHIQNAVPVGNCAKETTHCFSSLTQQFFLQIGVLFQNLLFVGSPFLIQLLCQRFVGNRQDLGRQQRRVDAAVDGYRGNRNTGRHLNRGQEGIHTVQHRSLAGDADHRQGGVCRNGACQMGRHTGSGDHNTEALFPGRNSKVSCFLRCAVGRENMAFKGNVQFLQGIHGLPQDGQIAVAPHNNPNFFHNYLLKMRKRAYLPS